MYESSSKYTPAGRATWSLLPSRSRADPVIELAPETLKVVFEPTQMLCVPDIIPALYGAVTVTVLVAVTFEQPPVPVTV